MACDRHAATNDPRMAKFAKSVEAIHSASSTVMQLWCFGTTGLVPLSKTEVLKISALYLSSGKAVKGGSRLPPGATLSF
jgi:hypothetical protein